VSALNSWHHKVHEIPRAGIKQVREASPEIREELAHELAIPACNSLVADYRINNAGKGRFELKGRVKAELTRSCVITLEPIAEKIDEPIDCSFVPPGLIPENQTEEEEALAIEDLEPILQDRLDVGRIVYEVVAASMAPYPRIAGAEIDAAPDAEQEEESAKHPFAALEALKQQKRDEP